MKRPRITIAQIGLVVAVIAVGLAAIRNCSEVWAGAMSSITLFVMLCSLLGVALERGVRRVYWSGFAVLGWAYLILTHAPWVDIRVGRHLLGPNLFAYVASLLHVEPSGGGGFQSVPVALQGAAATGGGFGGMGSFLNLEACRRIGASLEALLWAFSGGWMACFFASRGEADFAKAVEALAAVEHEQWMHLAGFLTANEAISETRREKRKALMVPYAELSEEQKEQDRVWARKAIAALGDAGRPA